MRKDQIHKKAIEVADKIEDLLSETNGGIAFLASTLVSANAIAQIRKFNDPFVHFNTEVETAFEQICALAGFEARNSLDDIPTGYEE